MFLIGTIAKVTYKYELNMNRMEISAYYSKIASQMNRKTKRGTVLCLVFAMRQDAEDCVPYTGGLPSAPTS